MSKSMLQENNSDHNIQQSTNTTDIPKCMFTETTATKDNAPYWFCQCGVTRVCSDLASTMLTLLDHMLLSFPPHSYNYGVANKLDCLPNSQVYKVLDEHQKHVSCNISGKKNDMGF